MKNRFHGMLALVGVLSSATLAYPSQNPARDEATEAYAGQPLTAPGPARMPPLGAVIYNNGPLITHPGGGFGGADASALQGNLMMTLFGFGHAQSASIRVADDFVVPVGQTWTVTDIDFYGYQTGGNPTTPTMNNVILQIWNGVPDAAGSTVVFGDLTTNRLTSSTFTNIYRVTNTTLTNNQRPVWRNNVAASVTLPAGTYWLDWSTGGTLASGPWVPPITILGTTTTGNALQKIGAGAWANALDGTFQQGLPFTINGPNLVTVAPISNAVDAAGNNVLQPNETVIMAPTWRNTGAAAVTLTGALSSFTGPAGPTYTIVDGAAAYGTIAPLSNQSCGANCYSLTVASASRPSTHWDSAVTETVNPSGTVKTWPLHVGDSFTDVVAGTPFYRFIETILHKNVTGGCTATTYCPTASTTRDQMAVFVLVSKEAAGYTPPACTGTPMFPDVPISSPFCRWIQELANRGVVSGCGGGNYCPTAPATREQMAVFVLRTLDPTTTPVACVAGSTAFADVPSTSPFCRWIEELARRGIVTGCGGGNYCPTANVTREQMSVFLAGTFGLVLYGL